MVQMFKGIYTEGTVWQAPVPVGTGMDRTRWEVFILRTVGTSVVDPKLLFSDPDPTSDNFGSGSDYGSDLYSQGGGKGKKF